MLRPGWLRPPALSVLRQGGFLARYGGRGSLLCSAGLWGQLVLPDLSAGGPPVAPSCSSRAGLLAAESAQPTSSVSWRSSALNFAVSSIRNLQLAGCTCRVRLSCSLAPRPRPPVFGHVEFVALCCGDWLARAFLRFRAPTTSLVWEYAVWPSYLALVAGLVLRQLPSQARGMEDSLSGCFHPSALRPAAA